jgi:hypothetical protein
MLTSSRATPAPATKLLTTATMLAMVNNPTHQRRRTASMASASAASSPTPLHGPK